MIIARDNIGMLREYDPGYAVSVDEYEPFIGKERVEELKRIAEPLVGRRWVNVNSTFTGGGVAEMLKSLLPVARGLGMDARWYAIPGSPQFFEITKTFHNLLQGLECDRSVEDLFRAYIETSIKYGSSLRLSADLLEIHDPQPLVTILSGETDGPALWRCHIDTSAPNPSLWNLFLPYINRCQGAVFTMPEFVGPGLSVPIHRLAPAIDPRAEKNRQYSDDEALAILEPLLKEHDVDPERPIVAAVSRYDVHKNQPTVLKAFRRLREGRTVSPNPYLIFLGNTASDDPEGEMVLASLRKQTGDDPDVRFWVNVPDNDRVVGALMRIARGFVHVSTREGFGLVVSEALWQGTPVVGSRVGGIKEQVIDGQTGYLVDALDVDAIADRMKRLLEMPVEAAVLGAQGREYVRSRYLLPELLRQYLVLIASHHRAIEQVPLLGPVGDRREGQRAESPSMGLEAAGSALGRVRSTMRGALARKPRLDWWPLWGCPRGR